MKLIVSFVVLSCLCVFAVCTTTTTYTPQCRSLHREVGNCVQITRCPLLFQFLLSRQRENLIMLQRLTCETDPQSEPIVCCPLKEIINPSVTTPASEQTLKEHNNRPSSDISHVEDSSLAQASTTSTHTSIEHDFKDLRNHPHFKLIPDLKLCGSSVVNDRIVGGKQVSHGAYPWMARIGYKNKRSGKIEYYCGGTVVNERYIITASHCTRGFDDTYQVSEVRLGEYDTTKLDDCSSDLGICTQPQDYQIEKVITHENYSPSSKQNDISLIRVDRNISFGSYFIRPVCLPFLKEYDLPLPTQSPLVLVAGWGRTQWSKAQGSQYLQEVKLPLISNRRCQDIYKRKVIITENQICAGGETGIDSCGGDSGGPLMENIQLPNSLPKTFQFGIVSFGPVQCGIGGLPGVYNRVSQYLSWILNNIEP